jgi:hypothetical protein
MIVAVEDSPCAVLFVSVVFAMIAPAAPVPNRAEQTPVYYYPMTVGAKWVYDKPGGDFVQVVSKVENCQGMTVVSVESVENNQRFPLRRSRYPRRVWFARGVGRGNLKHRSCC